MTVTEKNSWICLHLENGKKLNNFVSQSVDTEKDVGILI